MSHHDYWPLQWGVVIGASLVAALVDIHRRRIPNWLTFPALLGGLIWSAVAGGWGGLGDSFLGMLLLMAPFFLLFVLVGGGAGDAKLMGAVGAWLGVREGVVVLLAVCACGLLVGVIFSLTRRKLRRMLNNLLMIVYGLLIGLAGRAGLQRARQVVKEPAGMETMPYGIAIFLGVCAGALKVMIWPMQ